MIEVSAERYLEARSEQVWMLVNTKECRLRWLAFADRIEIVDGEGLGSRQVIHGPYHRFCNCVEQQVTAFEPSRRVEWTNTAEHMVVRRAPTFHRHSVFVVELHPEGAGTRVRIASRREPAGPLRGLAMRLATRRSIERNIHDSLEALEQMLHGGAVR